jgi:hypothetical protein
MLDDMKRCGVTEESGTPWSSPAVITRKQKGTAVSCPGWMIIWLETNGSPLWTQRVVIDRWAYTTPLQEVGILDRASVMAVYVHAL